MQIKFGQVYRFYQQDLTAAEKAEAFAAQKRDQKIDAKVGIPRSRAEEIDMHALVYTNEGDDNALDVFERLTTEYKTITKRAEDYTKGLPSKEDYEKSKQKARSLQRQLNPLIENSILVQ